MLRMKPIPIAFPRDEPLVGRQQPARTGLRITPWQDLDADIVDLNHVLGGLDRLLMQVAASKIEVETSLHNEAVLARVDIGQLELALINLVKNASDASPERTRIIVATSVREEGGENIAEVSVADEGSGMPPEVLAKATEPFFTTKAPGKGTGLGLSMVAGFCRQSNGRMLIETQEGQGTTIRMAFPQVLSGSDSG
jgi:signal transduction histidine kinase